MATTKKVHAPWSANTLAGASARAGSDARLGHGAAELEDRAVQLRTQPNAWQG